MDENLETIHEEKHQHKHHFAKYIIIFFATLVGAFLAFYFAADMTIKTLMSPEYQMMNAHRIMKQQERMFHSLERENNKMENDIFRPAFHAINPVELKKEDNQYIIIIDLKPFGNNPDKIKFQTTDNMITISGDIKKEKRGSKNMMSFSQTYVLDEEINKDEITKKQSKHKNKYIITIPIKD